MTKNRTSRVGSTLVLSAVLLFTSSLAVNGDEPQFGEDGLELNWKISENDSIFYSTVMKEVEESTLDIDFDQLFDGFGKESTDTSRVKVDSMKQNMLKTLRNAQKNTNITTVLSRSVDFDNVIDIEMIAVNSDDSEDEDFLSSFLEGTVLRGSVYTNGVLHSFWMKSAQKNLLSLFFELPAKKLKKGDTWSLDNVNYIGNDQNFRCREADKSNVVTLTDIKKVEGETIAVIEYAIYEYVSGDFSSMGFIKNSDENDPLVIDFQYTAKAEFSVDQGKWLSYDGIMSIDMKGYMDSKQIQSFSLIER